MRHIVVYHHRYTVYIYAAGHDICSHKHIRSPRFEIEHHFLSLVLVKVGVHLAQFHLGLAEFPGYFLNLQFGGGEHKHAFCLRATKQFLYKGKFLRFVAEIRPLVYLLGRT